MGRLLSTNETVFELLDSTMYNIWMADGTKKDFCLILKTRHTQKHVCYVHKSRTDVQSGLYGLKYVPKRIVCTQKDCFKVRLIMSNKTVNKTIFLASVRLSTQQYRVFQKKPKAIETDQLLGLQCLALS